MTALIYCPFPDPLIAEEIGNKLLDEKLIGCINIGESIRSLFAWSGERGSGSEIPALLKTDRSKLQAAVARLETLHPYEAPAILGWNCDVSGRATREWLTDL